MNKKRTQEKARQETSAELSLCRFEEISKKLFEEIFNRIEKMLRINDHSHDDCQYALERCDRLESCHDNYQNLTEVTACDNWDPSLSQISDYDEREKRCIQHYGDNRHNQCKSIYNKLFWEKELMRAQLGDCKCKSPEDDDSMTEEKQQTCTNRWTKIFVNPCFKPEVHHLTAKDNGTNPYNPDKHKQCTQGFSHCISNVENVSSCGLPLMNISINCRVEGECSIDNGKCIDSLANFFFNDVDPFWTRIMFNCCEHENDCYGIPEHVFSPWKCLGKNPFYSCMSVRDECAGIEGCLKHYNNIMNPMICNPIVHQKALESHRHKKCPHTLSDSCAVSLDAISLWYCSCENMTDYLHEHGNSNPTQVELDAAYSDCMVQKSLFTHNECHLNHMYNIDIDPNSTTIDPPKEESPPSITLILVIILVLLILAAFLARLRWSERVLSLRWSGPRELYRNWRSAEGRPLSDSLFSNSRPPSCDERNANCSVMNSSRSRILPENCANSANLHTNVT